MTTILSGVWFIYLKRWHTPYHTRSRPTTPGTPDVLGVAARLARLTFSKIGTFNADEVTHSMGREETPNFDIEIGTFSIDSSDSDDAKVPSTDVYHY